MPPFGLGGVRRGRALLVSLSAELLYSDAPTLAREHYLLLHNSLEKGVYLAAIFDMLQHGYKEIE